MTRGPQKIRFSPSVGVRRGPNAARLGMNEIMANYKKLIGHLEGITPGILYNALEPTFEISLRYCPKDTGALRNSGYLETTTFRGIPTVQMGYGKGGYPAYAATVHENLEWRHKEPTRAKWLQVALAEDEQNIQRRIVEQYRGVFA